MARPVKVADSLPSESGLTVTYVPLSALQRWNKNPKTHNVPDLRKSIIRFGFVNPVARNSKTGELVAGHGRLDALEFMRNSGDAPPRNVLIKDGEWLVPTIDHPFQDKVEAAAYALADNRLQERGGWNNRLLAEVLSDLALSSTLEGTGFNQQDLDKLVTRTMESAQKAISENTEFTPAVSVTATEDGAIYIKPNKNADPLFRQENPSAKEPERMGEMLDTIAGAYQLKEELFFPSKLPWNVPELRTDMLVESVPEHLQTWGESATPDDGVSTYLYVWSQHTRDLPFDRAILSFYVSDEVFESLWEEPNKIVAKMLNAGVRQAVTPDYSIFVDFPAAINLFQVYRNMWAGRYFQEAGIRVIPSLSWGEVKDVEWMTLGIPKNCPVMCCQLQSLDEQRKLGDFGWIREYFEAALDRLRPESLIVYANNTGYKIIDSCVFSYGVNIVKLDTRSNLYSALMKQRKKQRIKSDLVD